MRHWIAFGFAVAVMTAARTAAAGESGAYLEIPLQGVFGEDIIAEAVEKTFNRAKENNVKHIVFMLDSPGGYVNTARQIHNAMIKQDDRFEYHVVVTRAVSASVWVIFAADHIYVRDGATIGGAVVYHPTLEGNEVDAKMNSALAAEVRASAEKKGFPSLLIDPMMLQESTVAAWKDKEGKIRIETALPEDVPPEKAIVTDTPKSVLTLTAKQALEVGLGKPFKGKTANDLGKEFGIEGWHKFSDFGEKTMEILAKRNKKQWDEVNSIVDQMKTLSGLYDQSVDEANSTQNIDRRIAAAEAALKSLAKWCDLQTKLAGLYKKLEVEVTLDTKNPAELKQRLTRDIGELRLSKRKGNR